jgi:hypothetical protein
MITKYLERIENKRFSATILHGDILLAQACASVKNHFKDNYSSSVPLWKNGLSACVRGHFP